MEHRKFMTEALEEAKKAALCGEVPVGAVVVKDGTVIAKAHNQTEKDKNPLCHCEILAINEALTKLSSKNLSDCTIYVSLEPCPMCMGAILHAKLGTVVFGAYEKRVGAAGSQVNLTDISFFRKPKVIGGYMEKECAEILKNFFENKRKNGER